MVVDVYILTRLSLTATTVDVERMFSKGRILLPHVRNRLTGQSVRAILCLSEWARIGLVKDKDIHEATEKAEVKGPETSDEVSLGWDDFVIPVDD